MTHRTRIAVVVLMGLIAIFAAHAYLGDREAELLQAANPTEVCVMTRDVPGNTTIDESLVALIQVPAIYMQPRALTDCREAVGRIAGVPLPARAQILATVLLDRLASGLPLPRGKRALPLDGATSGGSLLRPGNIVDIFVTIVFAQAPRREPERASSPDERTEVHLLMEQVPVLAVGQEILGQRAEPVRPGASGTAPDVAFAEPTSRGGRTITVSVSPRQAQELILAQHSGRLTLVLRNAGDSGSEPLGSLDPTALFHVPLRVIRDQTPGFGEYHGSTN